LDVVTLDEQRSIEVFSQVTDLWEKGLPPFDRYTSPEVFHLPDIVEVGSRMHACWLFFYGFLNRFGRTAEELGVDAREIVEESPCLIDPLDPLSHDISLYKPLVNVIPLAVGETHRVDWWIEAMGRLRQQYNGDPRQIFFPSNFALPLFEQRDMLIDRMCQFPGIKHKIGQMILGWMQETEWTDAPHRDIVLWQRSHPNSLRRIPVIAIDRWLMRLIYQLGLVTEYQSDISTAISRELSDKLCTICHQNNINHNHLGQALWHVGSKICNANHLGGRRQYRHVCHTLCPLKKWCNGRVPSNYKLDKPTKKRRHSAKMGWGQMVPHPPTLDDLWDDD
jgi:hypothetical protein